MKHDLASRFLDIAPEVQSTLNSGGAVVALESTIITHGMPLSRRMSRRRATSRPSSATNGAVPATIAIIDGRIKIGLVGCGAGLARHARGRAEARRADLAFAVAAKRHGATTVAATMICAHLAGIRVFATGGIGGVHQGAERASTSRPTSTSWPARRCSWSAPAPRRSSTCRGRSKCSRPAACRSSATGPTVSRLLEPRRASLPVPLRLDARRRSAEPDPHQGGPRARRRCSRRQSRAQRRRDSGRGDERLHRDRGGRSEERGVSGKAVTPFPAVPLCSS